ncbi:hypothetical protein [Pseudomonas chlororaphis]|uniref:hypothetical protein n=1 Tax=Pseudomonas chlororaphis TaxID=587753 RepID=UPI0012DA9869|nr:hypothetical protein [Pseudomonas chlororaphis]
MDNTLMSYTPSPVIFANRLFVFHTAAHEWGQLWFNSMDTRGNWAGDTEITSNLIFYNAGSPPVALVYNDVLYVFYVGSNWQIFYIWCTADSPHRDKLE